MANSCSLNLPILRSSTRERVLYKSGSFSIKLEILGTNGSIPKPITFPDLFGHT